MTKLATAMGSLKASWTILASSKLWPFMPHVLDDYLVASDMCD